jgi:hypothetical protein
MGAPQTRKIPSEVISHEVALLSAAWALRFELLGPLQSTQSRLLAARRLWVETKLTSATRKERMMASKAGVYFVLRSTVTPIIKMVERHYCAHPLVSGYAPPEPIGIKLWAVQQMYNFCVKHELPEVWAYLWENWYRRGRWERWACCMHDLIPRLKTTMILESQEVELGYYTLIMKLTP